MKIETMLKMLDAAAETPAAEPVSGDTLSSATQQLCVRRMRRQLVPCLGCEQASERREVVLLIEVKQHLAVSEILYRGSLAGSLLRVRLRLSGERGRRDDGRPGSAEQRGGGARARHRFTPTP